MTPEVLPGDVLRVGALGSAVFSADGTRRRWLSRQLSGSPKRLGFIMLNPSRAGADDTDNTVTRCIGFGRREEAGEVEIGNLSDLIETDSKKLTALARQGLLTDGNSRHYLRHVLGCDVVICAWGAHPWARGKLATFLSQTIGLEDIRALGLKCLRKTQTGAPEHPLYMPAAQPLESWP